MANTQFHFLVIYQIIILFVLGALGNNEKFESASDQFRMYDQYINAINMVTDNVFHNWTGNHDCLYELNAIKNGLINFERWAIELADSWGKIPSGILRSNNYQLGSFSQCVNIDRYGIGYQTQYCLAELKLYGNYGSWEIFMGICFPAVCSKVLVESIINNMFYTVENGMTVRISDDLCQFKDYGSNFKAIDLATIGLLGIVLILLVASTAYDILYTLKNYTKYQPFLMFSMYTNGMKLFDHEKPKSAETIDCIHGIRALSALSIVLHHILVMYEILPVREKTIFYSFRKTHRYSIAYTTIAVDSFYTISGLLASWKLFAILKKNGGLNIGSLYLHRYLRLTPLVLVVLLISRSVLRFLGEGPYWKLAMDFLSVRCEQYWWTSLLYVQNYVNPNHVCQPQTWFLSVDMQLHLLSPFLVYAVGRFKLKAIFVLLAAVLISIGYTLNIYIKYGLTFLTTNGGLELSNYPTHVRFPSWIIGFITGYFFIEFPKHSVHIPKKLNWFAWILSLSTIIIVVFTDPLLQSYDSVSPPFVFGLHWTIGHVFWSIALCYIIFACVHGSGGPVNYFLSHAFWLPISKLSFSIYIVHFPLIYVLMFSLKAPLEFSELILLQNYFGICVLSIIVATIATLAFESPTDMLVEWISTQMKSKKKLQ